MRTFYSLLTAAVLILVATESHDAWARASQGGQDPWNADHIDRLPPEIRGALTQMCGSSPRAGRYFATYLDNARMIRLHFEHLNCSSEQASFCKGVSCLQQEYLSSGGHYRLIRTFYAGGND